MSPSQLTSAVVAEHLPMVRTLAREVQASWPLPALCSFDDLVSEGLLGLVRSWQRFEEDRGSSFQTYARYRIRGSMLDALRKRYTEVNREVPVRDQMPEATCTFREDVAAYGTTLRDLVANLNENERALLVGRLEGETFAELGARLGTSKASAFRHHEKVLAHLREGLATKRQISTGGA